MSRRPPHDPFPMRSEAARAMEESVVAMSGAATTATAGTVWNSMATATEGTLAGSSNDDDDHAGKGSRSADGSGDRRPESGREGLMAATDGKFYDSDDDDDDDYNGKGHRDSDDALFLDRPLWESRALRTGGIAGRLSVAARRTAERLYRKLYGDQLPIEEMVRTLTLASTLFFMIGGYWLLRSLKDPILTALCGVSAIPKAKMLSVPVVLVVVTAYNHLLDSAMPKHHLFYVFGMFYAALFTAIALLLMHPKHGLANEQPSPYRVLGWISYCSIESFGSVMVSLFWSFANSNTSLATAKASYGVMVAAAQVGSVLGPTFIAIAAPRHGPARCYLVGAFCMLLLQGTMYNYIRIYGVSNEEKQQRQVDAIAAKSTASSTPKKQKAGITEGLVLFWEHNYVKGIFAISCLFMVEVTIVDYTMKVLAQQYFAEEHPCTAGSSCFDALGPGRHGSSQAATAAFTAFMGLFGQATNVLSFLLSSLGTGMIIRVLGLRCTLLLFPTLCLVVICIVRLSPTLYTVFGAMMALKGCSYALNNPTKEILYQPTSPAVRYKAKSWIDIFGARGSKALGSVVTNAFSDSAPHLVANGSLVGMAVATFLIWNARFMGQKFDEYTATGYVVGGGDRDGDDDAAAQLELALHQNDVNDDDGDGPDGETGDTSCAIADDDDDDDDLGPEEEGQSDSDGNDGDGGKEEKPNNLGDEEEGGPQFAKKPDVQRV
jgi:ATP:ADP antiporter, AAA family